MTLPLPMGKRRRLDEGTKGDDQSPFGVYATVSVSVHDKLIVYLERIATAAPSI